MPLRGRAFSSFQPALGEGAPTSSFVVAGLSCPCCLGSDLGSDPGQRWAVFLKARYPVSDISGCTVSNGMVPTIFAFLVERNGQRMYLDASVIYRYG